MSNDHVESNADKGMNMEWDYEEEYYPPWLPALILFPPLAPFFWKYHVRVNKELLSLGYSHYFYQEIERCAIEKAESIEHINGMTQFGGWGYRKNLQWITGYIATNGPGIRLTYKQKNGNQTVTIIFNCQDAKKVCDILNTPILNDEVH